jgi:hypothetical protein
MRAKDLIELRLAHEEGVVLNNERLVSAGIDGGLALLVNGVTAPRKTRFGRVRWCMYAGVAHVISQ